MQASPELHASLPSLLTWHWITPFVKLGNTKILQKEDLYELNPADRALSCEELWKKASADKEQEISVWVVLFRSLGKAYFMAALWKPVWLAAVLTQVYVLKALVHSIESQAGNLHWWRGLLLVSAMSIAVSVQSIAQNNLLSSCQRISMRARSMINMAIYDKLLSLKLATFNGAINEGLLLNLVNNDTQKLVEAGGNFHFAWFSLVEILVVSSFIVAEAGIAGVPGVMLVLLAQPLPIWMSWVVGSFRLRAMGYTDERMRLVGELLAGIKTVKFNGWTGPFLRLLSDIRNNELRWIKGTLFLKFLILTLKDGVVPIASMLIFLTYARLHRHLTASMSFSVLALLGVLVRVFNFAPTGIQYAGEAVVAVQRLQRFLNISNTGRHCTEEKVSCRKLEASVCVQNGWFSWSVPELGISKLDEQMKDGKHMKTISRPIGGIMQYIPLTAFGSGELVLENINLNVRRGHLIGITGSTGSGKSSLLVSLLGETLCLKGTYFAEKPVAYAPQQPWIFNDTIRNNVLLGCKYNAFRYQEVMAACALEHDISHFSASHETEIGDRGVNLSGGQKARISLARACYSSAPVALLDDPFSAVDQPTANYLIQNVLHGVFQGRTVILVTHNTNALEACDKIYTMDAGKLQAMESESSVIGESVLEDAKIYARDDTTSIPLSSMPEGERLETVNDLQEPPSLDNERSDSMIEQGDAENLDTFTPLDHPFEMKSHDGPLMSDSGTCLTIEADTHPENFQNRTKSSNGGTLVVKEDRVEGVVTWATFKAYLGAGRYSSFVLVMGAFLCTQAVRVMLTYWLAIWADEKYHLNLEAYAGIYACLIAGAIVLSAARALVFSRVTNLAAEAMHKDAVRGIFNSPLSFFEQNLSGRMLNRLSKDQACIDELLPNTAQSMLENVVGCVGSIAIIAVLVPWFLLALPLFIGVLLYYQRRYTAVSRELKRLDGISRSPIVVHFIETLQGITSIRAYNVTNMKRMQLANLLDGNNSACILFQHVSRWLSFRLDLAATVCVTVTALLVVLFHDHIEPGIAGVILVQSLQLTGLFQYGMRMAADTENHFTSVERVRAYSGLQQESPLSSPSGLISNDWPSQGGVTFVNYSMAYREDLTPVLCNVNLQVRPQEKVGVLGRTGAGKSTLASALFHMVENAACSGSILIDGVNIKFVGVDDLRQRLSIVPQDPVLFKETIRMNLDPFEKHAENEIYEALKAVQLSNKIRKMEKGLYAVIGDEGNNFSVGEGQLLCLARAILRRSRVLVMDEATSAVDVHVDNVIQKVLNQAFKSCTVISIAHRISSVHHCDRFLLLSHGGHITELEDPQTFSTCLEVNQASSP